jgi:hypothetical protein
MTRPAASSFPSGQAGGDPFTNGRPAKENHYFPTLASFFRCHSAICCSILITPSSQMLCVMTESG